MQGDRGSQYPSIKYTERLADAGIEPAVGSAGGGQDSALAETINHSRAYATPSGASVPLMKSSTVAADGAASQPLNTQPSRG